MVFLRVNEDLDIHAPTQTLTVVSVCLWTSTVTRDYHRTDWMSVQVCRMVDQEFLGC